MAAPADNRKEPHQAARDGISSGSLWRKRAFWGLGMLIDDGNTIKNSSDDWRLSIGYLILGLRRNTLLNFCNRNITNGIPVRCKD